MAGKVKRAVEKALHRNTFTADQSIRVLTRGRLVVLAGEVDCEDLIYEAVATAEAVSSLLVVHNRLTVCESERERELEKALC